MTTGARLVSLSALPSGTAMAHLMAITTGGAGPGLIVNDGIATELQCASFEAILSDAPIVAEIQDQAVFVEVVVPCQ